MSHAANTLNYTTAEWQGARRPIASLISKLEKAQQKLSPATWQHSMVRENLKALHISCALMDRETEETGRFTRDDLQDALSALASMTTKATNAQAKFSPGLSQHTLLRNRLKAFRIAEEVIKLELSHISG